jgi:hypothetical protein
VKLEETPLTALNECNLLLRLQATVALELQHLKASAA